MKKRTNGDYLKAVNVVTLVAMVPNKVGILISLIFSLSEFAYNAQYHKMHSRSKRKSTD